jgi:hypothetical protein
MEGKKVTKMAGPVHNSQKKLPIQSDGSRY